MFGKGEYSNRADDYSTPKKRVDCGLKAFLHLVMLIDNRTTLNKINIDYMQNFLFSVRGEIREQTTLHFISQ